MENQNCCEDGKQLRVNADKNVRLRALFATYAASLVLKRSIIISCLIGIMAEPGCAQQSDKPKHANAAAKRCKPAVFYKYPAIAKTAPSTKYSVPSFFCSFSFIYLPPQK